MKPTLAVLGIGIMVLGFFGITRVVWLGWLEVIVGVVALLAAASHAAASAEYGGVGLGIATLLIWIVALASGVVGWLTWLTFIFGVAFVLSSPMITQNRLPPGRGAGPTFPPR